jgi:hypothetical protein
MVLAWSIADIGLEYEPFETETGVPPVAKWECLLMISMGVRLVS